MSDSLAGFGPPEPAHDLSGFGPVEEAPGALESGLRGAAQGATLGFADELTGAGEAALDRLMGAHADIVSLYKQHRDESRAKYKAAQEANPTAYGAGELGGGLATALVPGLGAGGVLAQGAKMAALGAASGLGHSEAEDARGLIGDAAVSGLVGGAAGAGGALIGKGLGALGNRLAPGLQDSADVATARSVGLSRAEIAAQKASGELGDTVGNLRDEGVATALTTPGKAAERIRGRIDELNAGRVGTLKELDNTTLGKTAQVHMPDGSVANVQGSGITGHSLADTLQEQLDTLRTNPNRTGAQEAFLGKAIRQYRALGDEPISFDQAEQYVRGFGKDAGAGLSGVRNDAVGALRDQLFDRASTVDPGAGDALREAGQAVSRLRNVADAASPAAGADAQIPHSVAGLGFRVAKTYGNSLKGSLFDRLAQVARTNPQALGKWGSYLAAAAQRGPAALASTHFALSQTDGSYAAQARAALDGGNE